MDELFAHILGETVFRVHLIALYYKTFDEGITEPMLTILTRYPECTMMYTSRVIDTEQQYQLIGSFQCNLTPQR